MTEEVIGVSVISADNEQHGFINANFLISKILSMSTWLDGMVLVVSRDEVIDIIKEMQTVDAEPIRHGEWIDMGDFETCSVCKGTHLKMVETVYGKVIWIKSKYCHNCGAKMDGGGITDADS